MPEPFAVLLVMPRDRQFSLLKPLAVMKAVVFTASTCAEAAELLRKEPRLGVVVTEPSLPDGAWSDLLNRAAEIRSRARVIVCSPVADERLWVQVLDAGGFDVLGEPCRAEEVQRVVEAASHV